MRYLLTTALACALFISSAATAQEAVAIKTLPFSAARQADDFLFISGQIARTADGKDVKESVGTETHQIMKNLGRILEEHDYSYDDLVSVTVWLNDIEDYHHMNKAYASYFEKQFPARACTGGAQIVFDFRVEIAAIAGLGDQRADEALRRTMGKMSEHVIALSPRIDRITGRARCVPAQS